VPIRLVLMDVNGVMGRYPVRDAGLHLSRRNDDNITQASDAPRQCFKAGGINTIIIGYHNFQNVSSGLLFG
jgi:hypothetical protein